MTAALAPPGLRVLDDPPWPTDDEAGDEPETVAEGIYLPRLRSALVNGRAIMDLPPPEWLIDDLLPLNSVSLLYGASGSGKSFAAISYALSVATGTWWMGRSVRQGGVLYIAGEGVSGLGQRVAAWLDYQNVQTCDAINWLTIAASLYSPEWADALVCLADELRPALVVVDTLARSMVGADENSSRDMGVVVEAAERVRATTGACVLLVHHTGKDVANGARGSSALYAGMETVISCAGSEGALSLKIEKQRNGPDGEKFAYRLVSVLDSCVLGDPRRHDPSTETEALPAAVLDVLEALALIQVPEGVPSGAWKGSSGCAESTFYRARGLLVERGYVENLGSARSSLYVLSEAGRAALPGAEMGEMSDGSNELGSSSDALI